MTDLNNELNIRETPKGIVFKVLVQPKSSMNTIVGCHNGALKIKITSPPVDGAANKTCIEFLAKMLNVSKSCFQIISGHSSRNKQFLFHCDSEKGNEKQMILNLLSQKKTK